MADERWVRIIEVSGQTFEAECIRRPFREGIQVRISLPNGGSLSVAELGLGEMALLEKAKALLAQEIAER
jgi:hypothetical protein